MLHNNFNFLNMKFKVFTHTCQINYRVKLDNIEFTEDNELTHHS